MIRVTSKFEKNITRRVADAFPREISVIVGKALFDIFALAQTNIPRVTHFMANSGQIRFVRGEQNGEIRYGAWYSGFVHEGTAISRAQPWLRQATRAYEPRVQAAFRSLEGRLPH